MVVINLNDEIFDDARIVIDSNLRRVGLRGPDDGMFNDFMLLYNIDEDCIFINGIVERCRYQFDRRNGGMK